MSESHEFAEQAEYVEVNDATPLDTEPSVILDEDRLDADPLEDGMDTAEDYSRTVKLHGDVEAEDQDSLAYRIPQEEPDVEAEEPPEVPIAERPAMDLDESVDDPANSVDGVGGGAVLDPLAGDGATEGETLTDGDGEVELGLSSAAGSNESTGLPADDMIGEAAPMDEESATEGAEQQALRVEQES